MNYKDTLFLPETEFSMKASLPTNEPKILQKSIETSKENSYYF